MADKYIFVNNDSYFEESESAYKYVNLVQVDTTTEFTVEPNIDQVITFNHADTNINSCFNLSTYEFTAPEDGMYLINIGFKLSEITDFNGLLGVKHILNSSSVIMMPFNTYYHENTSSDCTSYLIYLEKNSISKWNFTNKTSANIKIGNDSRFTFLKISKQIEWAAVAPGVQNVVGSDNIGVDSTDQANPVVSFKTPTSPTDGQIIQYNNTTGRWEAIDIYSSIRQQREVFMVSSPPTDQLCSADVGTTIQFNDVDTHSSHASNWNSSTYEYTIANSGWYDLRCSVQFRSVESDGSTWGEVRILINGGVYAFSGIEKELRAWHSKLCFRNMYLSTGDKISAQVYMWSNWGKLNGGVAHHLSVVQIDSYMFK